MLLPGLYNKERICNVKLNVAQCKNQERKNEPDMQDRKGCECLNPIQFYFASHLILPHPPVPYNLNIPKQKNDSD